MLIPECDSLTDWLIDWARRVYRLHQHSIGYIGDSFYRSKDPTNSIKVLKEHKAYTINTKIQLEIWGRAQHEAARRPKYDLKYILGSCKVCKNLRGQHP